MLSGRWSKAESPISSRSFFWQHHINTSLHPASHTSRRMLYTKFIIPIFTLALTCQMLRTSRLA
ncbi:hypothetical protein [Candidatus Vondammii sp. HM_W22]|uniref:hypothetical protein n=1 Tax=Candidatus Vondammii sp. HM_W22 TaxID=2687299 RepID=UPI001F135117|nr:hypothetical protein [Candidatus Vondammii sp. HM_W22]